MARRNGQKRVDIESPVGEAVMYRDADYGAMVLESVRGGLACFNFGFIDEDMTAVESVLSRYSSQEQRNDSTMWYMDRDAHSPAVLSTVKQEMRLRGYESDKLAERAIIAVKGGEIRRPDLPTSGKVLVHEAVEGGIRQHLGMVTSSLRENGSVSAPSVRYFARPNAPTAGAVRAPFVVARFFVNATRTAPVLREAVLKAVGEWQPHLVKLSVVAEAAGKFAVEIGLAIPATVCESFMDAAVPVFEHSNIIGVRQVEYEMGSPLTEEERRDIVALGRSCSGCVRMVQEKNRLVAQIPSGLPGNYGADYALHERLAWLQRVLEPWRPNLLDIGSIEEMNLEPETRKADLRERGKVQECDEDETPMMAGAQAAALVSGDTVATLAARFAQMPPAWWSTPQGEDALRKAKALIKDEEGEEAADRFDKQLELLRLTSSPTMKSEGAKLTPAEAFAKLKATRRLSTELLEPLGIKFDSFLRMAQLSKHESDAIVDKLVKSLESRYGANEAAKRVGQMMENAIQHSKSRIEEGSVGETIFSQIKAGATDKWMMGSWGIRNIQGTPDGLMFDVSGAKFKGRVIIHYNHGHDLYDIDFGKVRNFDWHSVKKIDGIDAENLARVLDMTIESRNESVREDAAAVPGPPLGEPGRTMLKAAGTFVPAAGAEMDGSDDEEEKNIATDAREDGEEKGDEDMEAGDGEKSDTVEEDFAAYLGEPGRGSHKSQYMLTGRGKDWHAVHAKARPNLHRLHPATVVTLDAHDEGPLPYRVDGTKKDLLKATGGKEMDSEDNRFGGVESMAARRRRQR